jgi:uncharacterized protein (TIGR00251 family)
MGPTTRLRLHVVPGAKRSGVVGRHGDAWKIRVTAPPERGAANDAVVRLLAEALDVPVRAVAVVSGHGTREKTVEVAGIDTFTIESALAKEAGG